MNAINRLLLILILITNLFACTKNAGASGGSENNGDSSSTGGTGGPTHPNVSVTTIAGRVNDRGSAEDGNGGDARFWNPGKMVYDTRNGKLYIADGNVIRVMDAAYNVLTYIPQNVLATPYGEVLDIALAPGEAGTLYVITSDNSLWKIVPDGSYGKATNIVARVYGGNDVGPLNSGDHFDRAVGLASSITGDVYFFNQTYSTLHHISLYPAGGGTVEKFAGKPYKAGSGTAYPFADGQGETATFGARVPDIANDAAGNIYIADFDYNIIRKVTPDGNVTSLMPFKRLVELDADGPIAAATSNRVTQVTTTPGGNLVFFSTFGNALNNLSAVRVLRPGKDVTTLVGYNYNAGYGDGNGETAGLGDIGGLAALPDGKTVYISEPGYKVIRKITIQ